MKCIYVCLFVLLWGCAHSAINKATDMPQAVAMNKAPLIDFLEISYQRGRNSYKFQVEKKLEIMFARSYVDQNLVQERKLSQKEYAELKAMAEKIFSQSADLPAKGICRTPFEMEISRGEKTEKIHGCRSSGRGSLVTELLHRADWMMLQED